MKPPELRTLKKLRERVGLTQAAVGKLLGVTQARVSKLELEGNCRVSSLRSYVKALGCELELLVRLGDGRTFHLVTKKGTP